MEFGLPYKGKTRTDFVQRAVENIWILEGDTKKGWRKLHSVEFQEFYWTPNIIIIVNCRRMRGACSTRRKKPNIWRILVNKHEENRQLGTLRRR